MQYKGITVTEIFNGESWNTVFAKDGKILKTVGSEHVLWFEETINIINELVK